VCCVDIAVRQAVDGVLSAVSCALIKF